MGSILQINNIYKSFGKNHVLNGISIQIPEGSITGLAGPSGSGKSTLLRCIQKLDLIDAGEIQFDQKSGFMFQDFQLFPHMTVLENLIYAPKLHNKEVDHKPAALKMLKILSIADKAAAFPGSLSGGQKQRVALARSLIMHPGLLLCDEPTSGLDVATIEEVVSLLKSVQNMGVTMVIASHDLDFLVKISDRIILLKEGKIAADVKPSGVIDPVTSLRAYYDPKN